MKVRQLSDPWNARLAKARPAATSRLKRSEAAAMGDAFRTTTAAEASDAREAEADILRQIAKEVTSQNALAGSFARCSQNTSLYVKLSFL